jgi:hypothetical protein
LNISLNRKKEVEELRIHNIKDITHMKLYFESIFTKHFHTFTKKIYKSYVTGLLEFYKYFKDYQKLQFMMKMKSDMEGEKAEEEKLFAREDLENNDQDNSENKFQNLKKIILEEKIIDKIYNTKGEDTEYENLESNI